MMETPMRRLVRALFTVNDSVFLVVAAHLIVLEVCVCFLLIKKVPYTEIDWSTYMQQVECYVKKRITNYTLIGGDTGPIVYATLFSFDLFSYPAGHLVAYTLLYNVTNGGKDIYTAQFIFAGFYILNLLLVFRVYYKSRKIPPFVLPLLCCTAYRVHSIFVLRLFNDPIAVLLFHVALNLFIGQHWLLGCAFYSAAVSVKMNILLYAPALFFLLLINLGVGKTIGHLVACAAIQGIVGAPFLLSDPVSYIRRSFDLGRVFLFEWTVNWRFLPESLFVDVRFHAVLLALHLLSLVLFAYHRWFRSHGGLHASLLELYYGIRTRIGVAETLYALFTANLLGVTFARSLHYQFYSWYFYSLPFLLFHSSPSANKDLQLNIPWLSIVLKVVLLLCVEVCWNTFPSTVWSSALLHTCHIALIAFLWFTPTPLPKSRKSKQL